MFGKTIRERIELCFRPARGLHGFQYISLGVCDFNFRPCLEIRELPEEDMWIKNE